MSGYLRRLVARTLGQADVVRPRLRPRFLTAPAGDGLDAEIGPLLLHESGGSAPMSGRATIAHGDTVGEGRPERSPEKSDDATSVRPNGSVRLGSPDGFISSNEFERWGRYSPHAARLADGALDRAVTLSLSDGSVDPTSSDDSAAHRSSKPESSESSGSVNFSDRFVYPNFSDGIAGPSSSDGFVNPNASDGFARPSSTDGFVTEHSTNNPVTPRSSDGFVTLNSSKGDKEIDPLAPPSGSRPNRKIDEDATIVNVSIGRIEVRSAAEPRARLFRNAAPAEPKSRDQLDAYLRARQASKR
jgi:hypothetical protein